MSELSLHLPNSVSSITYSDAEVIAAIREERNDSSVVLRWFFQEVKPYAIGRWRKKYRDLNDDSWDDIFSDSALKLMKRLQNGLTLQPGTRLKSYFTTIVEYAVLDYFGRRNDAAPITHQIPDRPVGEEMEYGFEKKQRAELIHEQLLEIVQNEAQVAVILLKARGYRYKEIVKKTDYRSEGACRNAQMKAMSKIASYLLQHPQKARRLKALLQGNI